MRASLSGGARGSVCGTLVSRPGVGGVVRTPIRLSTRKAAGIAHADALAHDQRRRTACGATAGGEGGGAQSSAGGDAGNDAAAGAGGLSVDDARGILGVGAAASFDDILAAKKRRLDDAGGDDDRRLMVEAAYDVLLMASMKRRLTGEAQVPTGVRYADVPGAKKRGGGGGGGARGGGGGGGGAAAASPALLQKLPGGVAVATPRAPGAAALQAAVFGGLVAWALGGALLESPEAQAADTGGLQLALAGAFSVYQLRDAKRLSFGRAAGITVGALVAGVMLGAALNAWLRVDLVPLGAFSSPGVFVTEFAIAAIAAACFFLA